MRTTMHVPKVVATVHAGPNNAHPALPVPPVRARLVRHVPAKVRVKRLAAKVKAAVARPQVMPPLAQAPAVRFALAQAQMAPAQPIALVAQPFLTSN